MKAAFTVGGPTSEPNSSPYVSARVGIPSDFTDGRWVSDRANPAEHARVIAGAPSSDSSRSALMLVDDDPDILFTYEAILTRAGYHVDSYSSSERALSHFALKPGYYSVVIMDVRMPEIDGLELYRRIKDINSRARILFVTAVDAGSIIDELPDVTRSSILSKPVDSKALLEGVRAKVSKSPDSRLWMFEISMLLVAVARFLI